MQLDPNSTDAQKYLSIAYYNNNELDLAERNLILVLKKNTKDYFINLYLYKVYSKKNDKRKACYHYNMALQNGMPKPEVKDQDYIQCE